MENLDNYNSIDRNPKFPTRMATGNARSYGLFGCAGSAGNRLFAWDLDRSLFWKRLDSTTMTKRPATKCCGCYIPSRRTVANLQRNRSARFATRVIQRTGRMRQASNPAACDGGLPGADRDIALHQAALAAYPIATVGARIASPRGASA
jgi:hypothetical protein